MDCSRHLYVALHCLFPPGAPCKGVYYTSMRAVYTAKGMVFENVGLAHTEKLPLRQRHLIKNCWMLVHWMLGGPVARVTPLVRLQILPHPQRCCCLGLLLRHFCCAKPVHISDMGTGTWLSCIAHSWQTADWETDTHFSLSRICNKWS